MKRPLWRCPFLGLCKLLLSAACTVAAFAAFSAQAQNTTPAGWLQSNQCEITSGVGGVACGAITSANTYKAGRVAPGLAAAPVDVWNICRYPDNLSANRSHPAFWNSQNEWQHTVNSIERDFRFVTCARPIAASIPASPAACSGGVLRAPAPAALPYARTGDPGVSRSAQYTCPIDTTNCAAGAPSTWIETATTTFMPSGASPDGVAPSAVTLATSGWAMQTPAGCTGTVINNICYDDSQKPAACVAGACGSVLNTCGNGMTSVNRQTSGGTSTWQCPGPNNGKLSAVCSVCASGYARDGSGVCAPVVNGACGTANGTSVSSAPTSGLCSTTYGNSAVTSTGSGWSWTCNGSSNGGSASPVCSVSKPTGIDTIVFGNNCGTTFGYEACLGNGTDCAPGSYSIGYNTIDTFNSHMNYATHHGRFCGSRSDADSSGDGAGVTFDLSSTLRGISGSAVIVIPLNIWEGIKTQAQADAILYNNNISSIPSAFSYTSITGRTDPIARMPAGEIMNIPDVSRDASLYISTPNALFSPCGKECGNWPTLRATYTAATKKLKVEFGKAGRQKKQASYFLVGNWVQQYYLGNWNGKVWSEVRVVSPAPAMCGTAVGQSQSAGGITAGTMCRTGTPSAVTQGASYPPPYSYFGGTYEWTCSGSNTVSCSATWAIDMSGYYYSDRRLKTDIVKVGHVNGHNIYEFSYTADIFRHRYRGVMAQEVVDVPGAVKLMPNGFYAVNYGVLGVPFEQIR